MKVNKLFCTLTIIGLITVSGCTSKKDEVNKNSYYNSYEKIKNDEVMNLSSTADVNFDYSDANEMYKNAEQIVIARITMNKQVSIFFRLRMVR